MNFADTVTYGSSTKCSDEMKQIINDDDVDRQGDTLIFNPYNSLNKEITLKEVQAILIDYGVPGIVYNLDLYKRAFVHRSYTRRPHIENAEQNVVVVDRPADCLPLKTKSNELQIKVDNSNNTRGLRTKLARCRNGMAKGLAATT